MNAPTTSAGAARARARPVVLLVDAHRDTLDLYAHVLAHAGFDVDIADDGAKAALHLSRRVPAIIVVEPSLQGDVSGYDVCHRMRTDADTRSTPLVAVTAGASPTDSARAFAAGCDAVLVKPCLPETLVGEVRRLLGLAPLTRVADSRAEHQVATSRVVCDD